MGVWRDRGRFFPPSRNYFNSLDRKSRLIGHLLQVEGSYEFKELLVSENLALEERCLIFPQVRDKLAELIQSAEEYLDFSEFFAPEQKMELFRAAKDKLKPTIESLDGLEEWCSGSFLCQESDFLLEFFGEFPRLIQSVRDFKRAMELIDGYLPEKALEFCALMQGPLHKLINNDAAKFRQIFEFLPAERQKALLLSKKAKDFISYIDFNAINQEQAVELRSFLLAKHPLSVWEAGVPYAIPLSSGEQKGFIFSHTLIKRQKKTGGWSFDVVSSEKIAWGRFGCVHPIEKMLTLKSFSLRIKDGERRAVKIQNCPDEIERRKYSHEAKLLELSRQISVKTPCFSFWGKAYLSNLEAKGYMVMERVYGMTLARWLKEVEEGKRLFSVIQRLEFSLLILQAYKRLCDEEIIHRDLKPENILVVLPFQAASFSSQAGGEENNEGRCLQVLGLKIIDYGFSYLRGEKYFGKNFAGTTFYMAPEILDALVNRKSITEELFSEKTDIYALGLILEAIFRNKKMKMPKDADEFFLSREKKRDLDLFHQISLAELGQEERNKITSCIEAMLSLEPQSRLGIIEAVTEFSAIKRLLMPESEELADKLKPQESRTLEKRPQSQLFFFHLGDKDEAWSLRCQDALNSVSLHG